MSRPSRLAAITRHTGVRIFAGLVLALTVTLVTLLNWPLPDMPRPGIRGDFLIANVAVVDVRIGEVKAGRDVVLRDGRIASIDEHRHGEAAPGLTVVDGTGKFLMPGLWDMHVHSLQTAPQYTHPLMIANGVTGVREMWSCPGIPDTFVACGDDIARWSAGLKDGSHLAPRYILRSSYAVNGPQGVPEAAPPFFRASNAEEARALVAHHAADGVDLIKVYTNVSPEAYDALAAEAARRGLAFAGHLPIKVSLETTLAAGQRSLEHPRIFLFACFRGADAFRALPDPAAAFTTAMRARFIDEHDRERCAELMKTMAASSTWWTPTLQVLRLGARASDSAFRADPRLRYIPLLFRSGLWQWDADGEAALGTDSSGRQVGAELYALAMQNVRDAHRAGVQIVAGTDAGDSYVFPGFAIHDELAEMVRAGLSPADALRSATIDAARFGGNEAEYGSIEVGKVADLLVLDANPLVDIRNTTRIAGLFFNGRYLDRSALDALLTFAENQAGSLRSNLQLIWAALRSPVLRAQAAD